MAHAPISLGSGGGYGSDDCTASLDYVLAGKTAIASDSNDEPGNGRMTVNSLLSFSCAAYSGRRILAKWQNPKAATGKPYSGVIIRYSTSGYPGKTGGTQIYKGAGSNTASGGQSQTYLDMPALNTTYYLSCTPYVTTNQGDLLGDTLNATVKTSAEQTVTIKATQNYTIPVGFSKMDTFCVGGGGGGARGEDGDSSTAGHGGGGGGGGYTKTVTGTAISAGQVLACTIGAGGSSATNPIDGGTTSIIRSGTTINSAAGGKSGGFAYSSGGNGGSGGGSGGYWHSNSAQNAGGSGGSNGGDGGGNLTPGKGQGTTTRAFGSSSGTAYSGGGGAGGGGTGSSARNAGAGGATGGGRGGDGAYAISSSSEGTEWSYAKSGTTATANTGGGGGGGGGGARSSMSANAEGMPGSGASGIILIRLY